MQTTGQPYGTFLCFGATAEPCVVLLSASALGYLQDKMTIAETRCRDIAEARGKVYAEYFGKGIEYAIPAWSADAMLALVEHYQGAHAERIKGFAACIYTGKHYGMPNAGCDALLGGTDDDAPSGGRKVTADKPKPRKPSGGNALKAGQTVSARA
jgi:hypothetical protein